MEHFIVNVLIYRILSYINVLNKCNKNYINGRFCKN
jgi:hypothetical protein